MDQLQSGGELSRGSPHRASGARASWADTLNRTRPYRYPLLAAALAFLSLQPVNAQQVEARVGRFWDSSAWTTYRVGLDQRLSGVLGVQLHGDAARRVGTEPGNIAGIGADVTVFRRERSGPYLVAGFSGGMGSETSSSFSDPWGSWSAGAGYDLFPFSFLSVGAEARWREMSPGGRHGPELALGFSIHPGGGGSRPEQRRTPDPDARQPLAQSEPATLADSVIATATEAMGRPYEYGGTGDNGEGFDCSGLIQYAYGKHGVSLPRRSSDQAKVGAKVQRSLQELKPGDLLTFSNRGGPVTHVGLYMGAGRFIHSATRGVQVSTLSASDPYGRWWYRRWVGVRRLLPQ
jgi:cell wall-associated NlpC family hydrolase